jgi:hypothetical protein
LKKEEKKLMRKKKKVTGLRWKDECGRGEGVCVKLAQK